MSPKWSPKTNWKTSGLVMIRSHHQKMSLGRSPAALLYYEIPGTVHMLMFTGHQLVIADPLCEITFEKSAGRYYVRVLDKYNN